MRLLQPIADLCEQLLRLPFGQPNEVQASPRENGYAVSIVALTAFLVEGACGRARYVAGLKQKRYSVATETLSEFGASDLADRVEEIFVVRDAVAHGHLWTARVSPDVRFTRQPTQLPGYGDGKFKKIVDLDSRTTRQLKLDVFPTRVDRRTAIAVIKESAQALKFLESIDRNFVYLTPQQVKFEGNLVPFYTWVRELPN
jgi:hypothetical protein